MVRQTPDRVFRRNSDPSRSWLSESTTEMNLESVPVLEGSHCRTSYMCWTLVVRSRYLVPL